MVYLKKLRMTTAFLLAAVLLVSSVPAGAAASAGGKAPTGYTDVRAGQWYYQDVADAVKSGVLENTSGKQFKAGGTVTLEEFSGMLVRCLSSVKKFNDVALENPVLTVRATLDADASMARDAALTRAQAVCLVFAATRATAWPQAEPVFDDLDGLTAAQRSAIECAAALGIVSGNGGTFAPDRLVTRAEALHMILALRNVPADAEKVLRPENLSGLTFKYENNTAYSNSSRARAYVAETPEPILRAMAKGGWTVEFVTGGIASVYPAYGNTNGLTDAARSLICVDVHGNVLTRDSTTILHELGHFVQHNAPAWLDGALNAAYAAERDALASVLGRSDCKKSASEFFAEAYRAYRMGKCDETRTPLTCAMLDRLAADGWVAGK